MKRLILLVSVLGLSFILTACGGSGEQKEPSKESQKSDKYEYEYYEVLNDGKEETLMSRLNIKIKMEIHI